MEDRKIGWHDWIHIRSWHYYIHTILGIVVGFSVAQGIEGDWVVCIFDAILSVIIFTATLILMSKDKELNDKNSVKRFWFKIG